MVLKDVYGLIAKNAPRSRGVNKELITRCRGVNEELVTRSRGVNEEFVTHSVSDVIHVER